MTKKKTNYGIDAPNVVKTLFAFSSAYDCNRAHRSDKSKHLEGDDRPELDEDYANNENKTPSHVE